jgi:predicted acetyltransferase
MDVELRCVHTDDELRKANDLMAKVHGQGYFDALKWLETCGATYPSYEREHTRIAASNGEVAAALRVNTETIRLGEARLKMGGFGWVTTAARFRHMGVCRSLMVDTLHYMRAHGYHVSMLFGIPNFYHRFGFATTLANHCIRVEVAEAATALIGPGKARAAKPGDLGGVQKIHAANDGDVACSIIRSTAHMTNRWDRLKSMRVLTNENGKLVGYLLPRAAGDHLAVDEVGVTDEASCQAVLIECARLAKEEAVGSIHFMVPPPHPFARFLLQFRSSHEMQILRDEGGMMAFVNTGEALEHMIPEWESLLASSGARGYRTEFTLLIDRVAYRVRANRGAMDVATAVGKNKLSLSAADFMHMLTGYRYVEDILAKTRRMLTPEAHELILALFPKRSPYVWPYDRF